MTDDALDVTARSDAQDYLTIVQRRRWWILLPVFVIWGIVWCVSWFLPATFRSEALIIVEQQEVPEQYVIPNVSVSLQDRLQSMTQQILSRTRLQATIDRFRLYPKRRFLQGIMSPEDPVEQMRKDITIDLVEAPGHPGELRAFKIDYSARSPELAQQVNSELTSLFIDENLKSQQQQSKNTTDFLESQLSAARNQLEQQEAKVKAFKARHFGDLPSQLETNVQILSGLQTELNNNERALDGAKQQNLYLESLLQQYQKSGGDGDPETSQQTLDTEILDLQTRLADARSRYTEDFPDVISLKEKLATTEKLRDQVMAGSASVEDVQQPGHGSVASPLRAVSAPVMQVNSQLKANQLAIRNYEKHATEVETEIETYRARLNTTPATEQELADISRGYDESKANYNSLLQKQNQSQLATSLEQRQQGEQFRVLDPPSIPTRPSSPNRLVVSCVGLIGGGVFGIGLVFFVESRDQRVWAESDVVGIVPGRILVFIPELITEPEERSRTIVIRLEAGLAAAMVLLVIAGNLYALWKG